MLLIQEEKKQKTIELLNKFDIRYIEEENQIYASTDDLKEIASAFQDKSTITSMITKFTFGMLELSDILEIVDNHRKKKYK